MQVSPCLSVMVNGDYFIHLKNKTVMSFKRVSVIMLPTNEKTNLFLSDFNKMLNIAKNCSYYHTGQHLYFLSDEEIKEGDWFIHPDSPIFESVEEGKRGGIGIESYEIHQVKKIEDNFIFYTGMRSIHKEGVKNGIKGVQKIIATTAIICTGYNKETSKTFNDYQYLPQPSQSFIEKYVEGYNKGNIITEVMVKYEGVCSNCEEYHEQSILCSDRDGFDAQIEPFRLKVNPKNNTITIRKTKDSWNREEVIRLLLDFNNDKPGAFDCSGWIEENL